MRLDIDTIVTDICISYPELAKETDLVRAIVTELIENQPVVTVDETFKARLRIELVSRANNQIKSKLAVPWWFIYTVPIGVTAILLLVVYPNLATAPQPLMPTDIVKPESSMMKKGGEESSDIWSTTMESSDVGAETTMVESDFFTATFLPDRQSIKVAYATLSQPGFIVVSGSEGIVATSELILPGDHIDLMIPVSRPVQSGVTYTATLHYDNGDDVFTEEYDFVSYDQLGQPVSILIVAP